MTGVRTRALRARTGVPGRAHATHACFAPDAVGDEGEQLALDLFFTADENIVDEEIIPVDELFEPDGRRRCPRCRRRLAPFAGRDYCMHAACPGGAA